MADNLIMNFVVTVLSLAYAVFMLSYLYSTRDKCKDLPKNTKTFGDVALVVTWLSVILLGLTAVVQLIALMSGRPMPRSMAMSDSSMSF